MCGWVGGGVFRKEENAEHYLFLRHPDPLASSVVMCGPWKGELSFLSVFESPSGNTYSWMFYESQKH